MPSFPSSDHFQFMHFSWTVVILSLHTAKPPNPPIHFSHLCISHFSSFNPHSTYTLQTFHIISFSLYFHSFAFNSHTHLHEGEFAQESLSYPSHDSPLGTSKLLQTNCYLPCFRFSVTNHFSHFTIITFTPRTIQINNFHYSIIHTYIHCPIFWVSLGSLLTFIFNFLNHLPFYTPFTIFLFYSFAPTFIDYSWVITSFHVQGY